MRCVYNLGLCPTSSCVAHLKLILLFSLAGGSDERTERAGCCSATRPRALDPAAHATACPRQRLRQPGLPLRQLQQDEGTVVVSALLTALTHTLSSRFVLSQALLKHGATCTMRATGGCHICRRIWALLQIHARQCRQTTCPVPRCRDLKEHLRRLQRQQAAMESRRRQAVTARYAQNSSPRG
jgi:hypothetical protein